MTHVATIVSDTIRNESTTTVPTATTVSNGDVFEVFTTTDEKKQSDMKLASSSERPIDPSDKNPDFSSMSPMPADQTTATTAVPVVPSNATAEGLGSSAMRESAGCILFLLICASVLL
jgi:hypothetical protein